tara:strand:+ start:2040 stop:2498 length:459 start_codon:yes stop_codon:yes gene_type:complete
MAMIKITNGVQEPYSMGQLRRDNKTVSFPKVVESSTLASYNVYSVVVADAPSYDDATQVLTQNDTATDVDGQWTYQWNVRDKTSDEIAADTSAAEAAARSTRNGLLAETDFHAMSDVTMSDAMTTYRQALRDVPSQAGFPNTITWPTKPEDN